MTDWLLIVGLSASVFLEAGIVFVVCLSLYCQGVRMVLNLNLLLGFVFLFLVSLISLKTVGYAPGKFFQQFVLLFYFYNAYYLIFFHKKMQISGLFRIYLKYTVFVSILALAQFFVYFVFKVNLLGFLKSDSLSVPVVLPGILRVSSLFTEPSQLSLFLTPAFGYYLFAGRSVDRRLSRQILLFVTILLTFSTMTYVTVGLMLVYKYLIWKRSIFLRCCAGIVVVVMVAASVFENASNTTNDEGAFSSVSMKIIDSVEGIKNFDPKSFEMLNLSSYATLTNLWVALNAPNRIIGTGLGTHEQNYEATYQSDYEYYGLNKQEGFSLGNRLYSEFGLVGLVLLGLFIYTFYNKANPINLGALFYLFTILVRGGHYTRYGIVFFVFLYVYTSRYHSRPDENENYCS